LRKGLVYKSTGIWYKVKDLNNTFFECRIKGNFKTKNIKSTNPIAVGDKVSFNLIDEGDRKIGIINKIFKRDNYIIRKSVKLSKESHIIASNIDQVFLFITLNNPPTSYNFIDRFLVAAEAFKIKVILIFNKIDTYSKNDFKELEIIYKTYKSINYECYKISSFSIDDIDRIKKAMNRKVNMFCGHSGVGKSTLLNSISPNLNVKTSKISKLNNSGKHTTTFAEMFDIEKNIRIIDTPGIKGFGLVDFDDDKLSDYFVEFSSLKEYCKFKDCNHINEPNCMVKKKLDQKVISASRYKSYIDLHFESKKYR